MSAILAIARRLLGGFWPYIIAAVAALLGILGLRRGAVVSDRRKRETEALKDRIKRTDAGRAAAEKARREVEAGKSPDDVVRKNDGRWQ